MLFALSIGLRLFGDYILFLARSVVARSSKFNYNSLSCPARPSARLQPLIFTMQISGSFLSRFLERIRELKVA